MVKLERVVELISGTPQFRIKEVSDDQAPLYTYYGQQDIEDDLVGIDSLNNPSKQVRTFDEVSTLRQGDIIFSLISGQSTIVSLDRESYLYTQNYVKLATNENIDSKYLVYVLNEDHAIKRQFQMGLQGSQVLKYTLRQMKELKLPALPTMEKQRIIGELYFNQIRLQALKNRVAHLETIITIEKMRRLNSK